MSEPEDPSDAPVAPPTDVAPAPSGPKDQTEGILILVLGIVSLWLCQLIGPLPALLGYSHIKARREDGLDPDPLVLVGMVLGIVATVIFVGAMLMTVGMMCLYAATMIFMFLFVMLAAAA